MDRRAFCTTSIVAAFTALVSAPSRARAAAAPPEPVAAATVTSFREESPDAAAVFARARGKAIRHAVMLASLVNFHRKFVQHWRANKPDGAFSINDDQRAVFIIKTATNDLLDHLLDSFSGTPQREQVQALVRQGTAIDVLHEDTLAAMDDALIPLAVMRQLSHREGIATSTKTMPRMVEFLERYEAVLVPA